MSVDKDIIRDASGKSNVKRFPVTQEQIDDVLNNELKNFEFPVRPVFNSRMQSNGRVKASISPSGLASVEAIEIGKQDLSNKRFLIDTLLHEYYEAEIFVKQNSDDFFRALSNGSERKRHEWINEQIAVFFRELGG